MLFSCSLGIDICFSSLKASLDEMSKCEQQRRVCGGRSTMICDANADETGGRLPTLVRQRAPSAGDHAARQSTNVGANPASI